MPKGMLSATLQRDRADALAAGFQDHLVKPVDPSTLISRISSLRRRRSQGQAPAR